MALSTYKCRTEASFLICFASSSRFPILHNFYFQILNNTRILSIQASHIHSMASPASFSAKFALGEAQRKHDKPRVIVTGGSGKLGRATVPHLSKSWEVISLDTRRPTGISEDGKSGLGGPYRLIEVDLETWGPSWKPSTAAIRVMPESAQWCTSQRSPAPDRQARVDSFEPTSCRLRMSSKSAASFRSRTSCWRVPKH